MDNNGHAGNGVGYMNRAIGSRIAERMAELDINQPDLARRMGVTNQAVSKWVRGEALPSGRRLPDLAAQLQCSVAWILTGAASTRTIADRGGPVDFHSRGRMVPVFSTEQAIGGTPVSDHARKVLTRFPCGPSAFELAVWDSSNALDFLVNDTIVIDPDEAPVPGDMVLAAIGTPRRAVFAKYTLGDCIELVPLNKDWPRHRIASAADGEIIGVMTEHNRPRRV